MSPNPNIFQQLPILIARIDILIGRQIDAILHQPRLQKLEAAWRSLHMLVRSGVDPDKARIKLLDIRFDEMRQDLERALDPEQSELFSKICDQEFDHAGGEPFGLLVGDYAIDPRHATHLTTLRTFSHTAASAFVPFVCAATPAIFGIDCFSDLGFPHRNNTMLEPATDQALQLLKTSDNSRFLALALPRFLLRQHWGYRPPFDGGLQYRERCHGIDDYLWGNAAFALATILVDEFQRTGWFTPTMRREIFSSSFDGASDARHAHFDDIAFSPPPLTDVIITENIARDLAAEGFIGLIQCWNTCYCTFLATPALHRATCLQHMLCASRIAHHLKAMMRDKIGSHATANDCERLIDNWLRQYTSATRTTDISTQARYPLAAARVDIVEDLYVPGSYHCILWLTLHGNNNEIESEIRLTTELIRLAA